jgi:hypothetical protein
MTGRLEEPALQAVLASFAFQIPLLEGHFPVANRALGYTESGRDEPGSLMHFEEPVWATILQAAGYEVLD